MFSMKATRTSLADLSAMASPEANTAPDGPPGNGWKLVSENHAHFTTKVTKAP